VVQISYDLQEIYFQELRARKIRTGKEKGRRKYDGREKESNIFEKEAGSIE